MRRALHLWLDLCGITSVSPSHWSLPIFRPQPSHALPMLLDRQPLCFELASDVSKSVCPPILLPVAKPACCVVRVARTAAELWTLWYVPDADRRCRTNSQKPNEELIQNFRASFPHLAQPTRSQSVNNPTGSSLTDALDVAHSARYVRSSF